MKLFFVHFKTGERLRQFKKKELMSNQVIKSQATDSIESNDIGSVATSSVVDVVASDKIGFVVVEKFGFAAVDLRKLAIG